MRSQDLDSQEVVYELFSFIFWTLTAISFIKYVLIVLKADDNREGNLLFHSLSLHFHSFNLLSTLFLQVVLLLYTHSCVEMPKSVYSLVIELPIRSCFSKTQQLLLLRPILTPGLEGPLRNTSSVTIWFCSWPFLVPVWPLVPRFSLQLSPSYQLPMEFRDPCQNYHTYVTALLYSHHYTCFIL